MDWLTLAVLLLAGFGAGFINMIAGGGSLLTLPALIFAGLPPSVANGTNRIAVLLQSITGNVGYASKGIKAFPQALYYGLSAMAGSVVGAFIVVDISEELLQRIIAVVMLVVLVITVLNPAKRLVSTSQTEGPLHLVITIGLFFLMGIYGGFLQAGMGFLVIATLNGYRGLPLAKTNAVKVAVIGMLTVAALAVFIWQGKVAWLPGVVVAGGSMAGAWVASRWAANANEKLLRGLLILTVCALAFRLWFF